jgi:hypothetical protein
LRALSAAADRGAEIATSPDADRLGFLFGAAFAFGSAPQPANRAATTRIWRAESNFVMNVIT